MMKILLDKNISPAWIPLLEKAGYMGKTVLDTLCKTKKELEDGSLITIHPRKNRIKLLPFKRNK